MRIFFNDFVIIRNNTFENLNEFYCNKEDILNYTVYYNPVDSFGVYNFIINDKGINSRNSLLPYFHYKTEKYELITPNFSIFFRLALSLTKDENSIKEFVLFNTPLYDHTFFNEVKRYSNIKEILFSIKDKIQFVQRQNMPNSCIYEEFTNTIELVVNETKDLKHGVLLSGGYESRINAAIAYKYSLNRKYFTWGNECDIENIIAKKVAQRLSTTHINIESVVSLNGSIEFLEKTGYIAHMSHSHTMVAINSIFRNYDVDLIWNGWGDLNGYTPIKYPTEIFSPFMINLFKGEMSYPIGWNREWINTLDLTNYDWIDMNKKHSLEKIFDLLESMIAPLIIGQTFAAQNLAGPIISPWFSRDIYDSLKYEEFNNPDLIKKKYKRVLWKGDFYYRLLKNYSNPLNYIKTSKGYYPFCFNKQFSYLLAPFNLITSYIEKHKKYPKTSIDDKFMLLEELEKIESQNLEMYNKSEIRYIIKNYEQFHKHELYKIIQVAWLLNKNKK